MKDFKMVVPECLRREIQKRLFMRGCKWVGSTGDKMLHQDISFIFVNGKTLSWVGSESNQYFLNHPLPEITLTEFYALTEKSESENKIEKIRDLIKQLQELTDDK